MSSIGGQPVSRWADAIAAHEHRDLDALLVHTSSIDQNDLSNIYDHGVVLVFFNVYSRPIGEMLGDSTIFQNNWMDRTAEPMPGDFYIILWRLTLCRNGEIALRTDRPLCPGSMISGSFYSAAAESLTNEEEFEYFLNVLLDKLEDRANALRSE